MSTLGDMLKYLPPRLAEAVAEESGRLGADAGAVDAGAANVGAANRGIANVGIARGGANGAAAGRGCFVTELRLRRELPCSLTLSDGRNLTLGVRATRSELSAVLARMTENSLHTHAATLRHIAAAITKAVIFFFITFFLLFDLTC